MTSKESTPASEDGNSLRMVAPAPQRFTETMVKEVWKWPDLIELNKIDYETLHHLSHALVPGRED